MGFGFFEATFPVSAKARQLLNHLRRKTGSTEVGDKRMAIGVKISKQPFVGHVGQVVSRRVEGSLLFSVGHVVGLPELGAESRSLTEQARHSRHSSP